MSKLENYKVIFAVVGLIGILISAFIALGIGAWIGWTMATTPPPKPLEEIQQIEEKTKEDPADTP